MLIATALGDELFVTPVSWQVRLSVLFKSSANTEQRVTYRVPTLLYPLLPVNQLSMLLLRRCSVTQVNPFQNETLLISCSLFHEIASPSVDFYSILAIYDMYTNATSFKEIVTTYFLESTFSTDELWASQCLYPLYTNFLFSSLVVCYFVRTVSIEVVLFWKKTLHHSPKTSPQQVWLHQIINPNLRSILEAKNKNHSPPEHLFVILNDFVIIDPALTSSSEIVRLRP